MTLSVYKCVCIIIIDNAKMFVYIIFSLQRFFAQNYLGHFLPILLLFSSNIVCLNSCCRHQMYLRRVERVGCNRYKICARFKVSEQESADRGTKKRGHLWNMQRKAWRETRLWVLPKNNKCTCATLRLARYVWAYWIMGFAGKVKCFTVSRWL